VTARSYVLVHSPLTGPVVWGRLPKLLRDRGYEVVVVDVQDDDEAPFAGRFVTRAAAQISAAELGSPAVYVAHSGAGPLLPPITRALLPPPCGSLSGAAHPIGGYVFLDAGIPRSGQPSRLDLLREEGGGFAATLLESLRAGARFPAWTVDDLADIVPTLDDRIALVRSLRPRGYDFFTEPLPDLRTWPDAPCGYLRTSAAYDSQVHIAEPRGWPIAKLELGHFPALADSHATLRSLLGLTARLSPAIPRTPG